MFNKNSGLVRTWINLIRNNTYTVDDIPNISNLREVVLEILNERG